MPHLKRALLALAAFVVLGFAATPAHADALIVGGSNPTLATGSITMCTLTPTGTAGISTFSFRITNTSPTVGGSAAVITGVGFDLPGTVPTDFSCTSSDTDFQFTNTDQMIAVFPNTLDFAFITGMNFNGGNPQTGITTGTFATFSIIGNFGALTANQLCDLVFVRFQSVPGGTGSDVGRAVTNPIPEPTTMLLLGTGLAGIAGAVRRRRANQA